MNFYNAFQTRTGIETHFLKATRDLLETGSTIPFLARYRKERTGGMDEIMLEDFRDSLALELKFEERKSAIIKSLEELGVFDSKLKSEVELCLTLVELEDFYLPYKPKRKTKASMAREKGLQALADQLYSQVLMDVFNRAKDFLNKEVKNVEEALQGARDIIAERISEDKLVRELVREEYKRFAVLSSKVKKSKEEEGIKFQDYFDFHQQLSRIPSHRFLAILRGNDQGFLRISASPNEEKLLYQLKRMIIKGEDQASQQVEEALQDSYKRLLHPSIETEVINAAKIEADEAAVKIFASNLQQLLMGAPLGEKRILAVDPGFRSGCKLVCLDEQGKLLHNETIYPHPPQNQEKQSMAKLSSLIEVYKIDAVAIGNGTAGRETEQLIQRMRLPANLKVFVVSENGASVYSASAIARKEFPEFDVTVRGAVSIGRRLQDPLAELVKIDPKSVGVGQYQHDVEQNLLSSRLDDVVTRCVNQVGVNLNTSSAALLRYVAGLGPSLAESIVDFRNHNGAFKNREDLLQVPRLGKKAFEQAAGFLRIVDGDELLDNSSVHPESYPIVQSMAEFLNIQVRDLIGNSELIKQIDAKKFVKASIGLPTITDILKELEKPGKDPRKRSGIVEFDRSVRKISDLKEGMILPGIVTNITAFGAFVDVGVKQDGLVHVSQIADRFIKDPMEVLSLHQEVKVKVMSVDEARKRIAFSLKGVK
ncbi:MAG: Tex family protein [Bacteroidia bacterium]